MNETQTKPPKRSWAQFSLRTLLLLMLLVATYLGGRYASEIRDVFDRSIVGDWEMTLPGGFVRPIQITHVEGDRYTLASGGVLSGVYQWKDDRLVVVTPSDKRMVGLEWKYADGELTLVAETPGTPTGASYLGATLTRPKEKPP